MFGYALFAIFFSLFVYFAPNMLGRRWPFVQERTTAMCYMLGTYKNYNNTNIISGLLKETSPNIVKIYYNICNQQITKLIQSLNLFERLGQGLKVGISETTRTQKVLYPETQVSKDSSENQVVNNSTNSKLEKLKEDHKFNE
jgi:hypothetical protein